MLPLRFSSSPRRILIIKPSAIGDVVHALPFLAALRRRFAEAHISWLVTPACAGLLEDHPLLNEVILFQRRHFGDAWRNPRAAAGLFRFTRGLRAREFDLVIDLQGLFRSGYLAMRTRSPLRIGFANARELAWIFYTHRVKIDTPEQHATDRYLAIAAALGCDTAPVEFPFATTDADRQSIATLIPGGPFAVLLPGTNWPTKRWPVEHFAALAEPLRQRLGLATVIAGGSDDVELAGRIPNAINLAGRTTLRQLVALLERAALVIANDSGPMHIAAALNRPLVALFGPTSPIRTGPYARPDTVLRLELPCSPCYSRRCHHQSCLQWLNPDAVIELAERQLAAAIAS